MKSLDQATQIVEKLVQSGYTAYFAGGWVRDYVMQQPSFDIDIATNASPQEVRTLFAHTILVGLAFGVVIVILEKEQFEVATFRQDLEYLEGRHPSAINFSTEYEDAQRRDFTINGMFYDPLNKKLIDYVGGCQDIKQQVIRTIGDPATRFKEDRLRMLRAVRFAARFDFDIDPLTHLAIKENASTLFPAVAKERIAQEFSKMASDPHFDRAVLDLWQLGLLRVIFPVLQTSSLTEIKEQVAAFPYFPQATPFILYLMELFPALSLADQLQICGDLCLSCADRELVIFTDQLRKKMLAPKDFEQLDGQTVVHLVAHPSFAMCFEVMLARQLDSQKRLEFLQIYRQREQKLALPIQRIQQNKPLLTGTDLIELGLKPGKQLGILLKEAERLAIVHDLQDKQTVIELLKQSTLWKNSTNG